MCCHGCVSGSRIEQREREGRYAVGWGGSMTDGTRCTNPSFHALFDPKQKEKLSVVRSESQKIPGPQDPAYFSSFA